MISFNRVTQRSAVRLPQKAEQLVEVSTEPGYALAVIATQAPGAEGSSGTGRSNLREVAEVFKVLVKD